MVAPAAMTTASNRLRRSVAVMSRPISMPVRNLVPSARICSMRRLMCRFSILNSGMRFPRGQPLWQKGMPQSMQRPACLLMIGSREPGT